MECYGFNKNNIENNIILRGLDKMPVGFFIYRAHAGEEILYANTAVLKLFECDTFNEFLEITGGSFKGIVYPDDYENVEKDINRQIGNNPGNFDHINFRIRTKGGKVEYIEDYGYYVNEPDIGPIFYVFIIMAYAHLDSLTHLPNRGYFFELAEEKQSNIYKDGGQTVMISFNLIGMKGYNGRYGYAEGDKLLIGFSNILRKKFGNGCCARFGENHFFAFSEESNIENKLDSIINEFKTINDGRSLPLRIGLVEYDPELSITTLCYRAQLAGESKGEVYASGYVWFDLKLAEKSKKVEYIISNIDKAISEGWIKIYTQPVMRALTGELCNCEALARWIDPVYGMISPGEFIPVLEANGLSYKLDIYVIRRVVELQQNRSSRGELVIPISVNISRADFDVCDPVEILISEMDSHDVRRNYICVEITETSLINDNDVVKMAIERFHDEGIEVWMDDFGSGYSSLNILKEFDFDEIKIDMIFLRNFNEKSKKIIRDTVHMAKNLGIHVLAEGVETQEQLDFLKSVGCEKIQGYYFGKPQSIADTVRTIREQNIQIESRETAEFYKLTGCVDIISDTPLALVLYSEDDFNIVYNNLKFEDALVKLGYSKESTMNDFLNNSKNIVGRKFLNLVKKAVASREAEHMALNYEGNYFDVSFKLIAQSRQDTMFFVNLDKIYYDSEKELAERKLQVFRALAEAFDSIYLVDYVNDCRTIVSSSIPLENENDVFYGLQQFYDNYKIRRLHVEDHERWYASVTREGIKQRLLNAKRGYFSDVYRVKNDDGSYMSIEVLVIAYSKYENEKYIVCIRAAGNKMIERDAEKDETKISKSVLWESFVNESNLKIFWKDKNRRFVGGSRSFIEYYDFKTEKDFVGKTDEELGWHIDDSQFKNDELSVIEKGNLIINSPGQNIVDGVIHYITANKFPIYENGDIIGLVGYAIDVDKDIEDDRILRNSVIDPITGMMNNRGMQDALSLLDDNYRTNCEDYIYALIRVEGYRDIKADYGDELAKEFMRKCADILRQNIDERATLSRLYACEFAVIGKCSKDYLLEDNILNAVRLLKNVKEIEGRSCITHVKYGIVHGSNSDSISEVVSDVREKLQNCNEHELGLLKKNERMMIDLFADIPMPYVIMRVILDETGNRAVDLVYKFVNRKYCELINYNEEELIDSNYLEKFPYTAPEILEFAYKALKGEYVYGNAYDSAIGRYARCVVAPTSESGCVAWLLYLSDSDIK